MRINYKELREQYNGLGNDEANLLVAEALTDGSLKVEDFSLRELGEAFLGEDVVREFQPGGGGIRHLHEAGEAVDSTAFSNITGQLVFSAILAAFDDPAFIGPQIARTIPTRLSGEKIPGVTRIGDKSDVIAEGMPYPRAGVGEEFVETPATDKRGFIVPVTKEAIFFDRTNLVATRASEVGRWLGVQKEKRLIDQLLGITNTYKRGGTSTDTYLTAGAYINTRANAAADALVDWQDVENAQLLFDALTDPNTNEPILIGGFTIIVPSAKLMTAKRILTATEVRHGVASATLPVTLGANPLAGYNLISSPYIKSRLVAAGDSSGDADVTWLLGDPMRAFAYMENWPITVTQAPTNSQAEFEQDIVLQFKASERGVPAVMEPRYMTRTDGHA